MEASPPSASASSNITNSSAAAASGHANNQILQHHPASAVHRHRLGGSILNGIGGAHGGNNGGLGDRKKTWSELKTVVADLRRNLAGLSSMVPMNVHFRTLSDGRTRIYFLSTPPSGWETTLLYADIAPASDDDEDEEMSEQTPPAKLQWHVLLEPTIPSISSNTINAREIQLLLERKRLSMWGITSYELHMGSGKMVFPFASTLYQCLDTGYNNANALFPSELRISQLWAALDPQICPENSDLIAYVSGGDIWVTHTVSGHGERLTFAHDGRRAFSEDPLSAGTPSYVMQEEFSRYQGYWWQPKSEDGIFRIVYEEVDETEVALFTFPSSQSVAGEYEEYRFPRAGTPNAKSKLKLVQFALSESLQITEICVKDLQYPLGYWFPWMEYIVRVGWTPDSKYIWTQLMNRLQQRMDLVLIPLDNFCESCGSSQSSPTSGDHSWKSTQKSITPIQVIYSETSGNWINVTDILQFRQLTDTEVQFIWASEESGFRHLYSVTSDLRMRAPNGAAELSGPLPDDMLARDVNLLPRIIKKTALTSGDWEVLGRNVWIDEERQLIYFMGLRDTPLEKHLYVISLNAPTSVPRLLTTVGNSYTIEFNKELTIMMQIYCNIHRLPSCEIFRVSWTNGSALGDPRGVHLRSLGYLMEGSAPENSCYSPSIYSPKLTSGETLYAMVFKPHNFTAGVRYPAVLNVYGGPEVQTVNNSFKGMRQLRMHMLAAQGYCVICVDSRGSWHRGVEFESRLRRQMGQVELSDQVEVLNILAQKLGYIDMTRVAIHGWSYGGYLSLMGLIQHPDVFKLAIAGAPVTDWEYYDTGYTERYMDLPVNNKQGYAAGSVLSYINHFPEEDNRLLIIHGLIDENVHFFHTSQLINLLIKYNKPYQLQVYPNERHSLRNLEASKHYETTLLSFLQNNL